MIDTVLEGATLGLTVPQTARAIADLLQGESRSFAIFTEEDAYYTMQSKHWLFEKYLDSTNELLGPDMRLNATHLEMEVAKNAFQAHFNAPEIVFTPATDRSWAKATYETVMKKMSLRYRRTKDYESREHLTEPLNGYRLSTVHIVEAKDSRKLDKKCAKFIKQKRREKWRHHKKTAEYQQRLHDYVNQGPPNAN